MRGSTRLVGLAVVSIGLVIGARLWAGSSVSASQKRSSPASLAHAAAVAIAHGQLDQARALATARGSSDPEAAAVLAQLAVRRGAYEEARTLLEPVASKAPLSDAALELGLLDQTIGRAADATRWLSPLLSDGTAAADSGRLLRAARAAQALGRPHDATALYGDAERAGGDPAVVETFWGELFLDKYRDSEAQKSFQLALKADARWAPALAGLARVQVDDDPDVATRTARQAIAIDPTLASPHLLLARLHLDEDHADLAAKELDAVLAANPAQTDALSLLAGMAYVKDDHDAFARRVAQVLAVNPHDGDVYRVAGSLAADHYRFDEAVALVRKALTIDPDNSRAQGDLGMHLMRTGDEAGARQALQKAFAADPFDVLTFNLLNLLDTLDGFVTITDGDLTFRMQKDEAPVLRLYAIPLAHQALAALSARYQFTPKGPILIEIFPKHDDFAVRNVGLMGMIGALGACFGRVVTMDSPEARPPGTFSWQATLWHELTHVITLQMSNQRIPRWLTEGISVYEEGRARPEWGRDMEVAFARALDKGQVLKLRDLNAGFTRPDTIALAYYEASLVVDHIVRTYGEPALRALIRSYAEGIDTETAITKTLHVSMDELQTGFDASIERRFGAMRRALHDPPAIPDGADVAMLRTLAAARPDSYVAQLALGVSLAKAGDAAAYAPLERAAALVPVAIGPESPHAVMATLAQRLGDSNRASREYEALLSADHTNIDAARALAGLAEQTHAIPAATLALDRLVALDPFDAQAHARDGRLALQRRDATTAIREFEAALRSNPADQAAAHCDLGESYLLAGRAADAKREALAALEIAPTFARAQDLLLKVNGGA